MVCGKTFVEVYLRGSTRFFIWVRVVYCEEHKLYFKEFAFILLIFAKQMHG